MLKVCQLFSEGSINRSLFLIFFRYSDSVYRLVLHLTQFQSQLIVENTEDSSKFYPNPSALQLTLIFFNRLGVDKSYQKEQTIHLKRLSWFIYRYKQLPITKPWRAKGYSADNPKILGSNHPMDYSLQSWTWGSFSTENILRSVLAFGCCRLEPFWELLLHPNPHPDIFPSMSQCAK